MPVKKKKGAQQVSRPARLKAAKRWLAKYRGKYVVRAYRRRFGVDEVCAVEELGMLGAALPEGRLDQARRDQAGRAAGRARRKAERTAALAWRVESDDDFSFIAGYTEGGAPYGIRWDEEEPAHEGPLWSDGVERDEGAFRDGETDQRVDDGRRRMLDDLDLPF